MKNTNRIIIFKRGDGGQSKEYKAVIYTHSNSTMHFASFYTIEQLGKFCELFGVSIIPERETADIVEGWTDKLLIDGGHFWKLSELQKNKKRIKALSNGSVVDCYISQKRGVISLFRPNPNSKRLYKPMDLDQQIQHKKNRGIY